MLGRVAVKKKVYSCKTPQIGIGLRIGKFKPLGECPDTRHNILNSIENFFLVHTFTLQQSYK